MFRIREVIIIFTVEFPYDIGTFVQVNDDMRGQPPHPKECWDDLGDIGTIACYNCVDASRNDDKFVIVVSGYKQAWCGEYLLREIRLLTEEEIEIVKNHCDNMMIDEEDEDA